VRLYSTGDKGKKIFYDDKGRGRLEFPENDEDIVLIKSGDGLPTYHFAHLCDDHFMRTTLVQRGEEWLSSLNLHLQLFRMMGWRAPDYIHVATINKLDNDTGNSRKLSKRTDPEANAAGYLEQGYPTAAVLNYLYNIVASGYEEEKAKKPETDIWNYPLKIKKIPISPALFGMQKLEWWAREFIATLPVDELLARVVAWADEYSPEWTDRIAGREDYLRKILSIERSDPKRIRKDFITWKQTLEEVAYFFDDIFEKSAISNQKSEISRDVCASFLRNFDINDDKDAWWAKIVQIASELGIKNGEAAMSLRVAVTGRTNTPDLYSIMQAMGLDRVRKRVENVLNQKD
jgi:glutamyl-tRNA synthetase